MEESKPKPAEEQIRELLCQRILDYLKAAHTGGAASASPSQVKTLAETYEILFGKYVPQDSKNLT